MVPVETIPIIPGAVEANELKEPSFTLTKSSSFPRFSVIPE